MSKRGFQIWHNGELRIRKNLTDKQKEGRQLDKNIDKFLRETSKAK